MLRLPIVRMKVVGIAVHTWSVHIQYDWSVLLSNGRRVRFSVVAWESAIDSFSDMERAGYTNPGFGKSSLLFELLTVQKEKD